MNQLACGLPFVFRVADVWGLDVMLPVDAQYFSAVVDLLFNHVHQDVFGFISVDAFVFPFVFEHALEFLVCEFLQVFVCLSLYFVSVFLDGVDVRVFCERCAVDRFCVFSAQAPDPEVFGL